MIRLPLLTLALLLALAFTMSAADDVLLIELPDEALATAVNATGTTVAGTLSGPAGGAFYWMPTTGVVFIGGHDAQDVSNDGTVIVGTAADTRRVTQAAIWLRAAEWRLLGSIVPNALPCDSLLSSTHGASADGRVLVGLAWNGCNIARAFRWEESTGMVDLGSTVAGRSSRANNISGDGNVVVGWQEHATGFRQGARWVNRIQELVPGPLGFVGEAFDANHDASVIVGHVCRPGDPLDQSAWMWTRRGGTQCLPTPRFRPGFILSALATSEDGRIIGGSQNFGLEAEAVIWLDRSPVYLRDYLRSHGVPDAFSGWINTGFVTDVSPNGRVLVGYGAGPTNFRGYIVILPEDPSL